MSWRDQMTTGERDWLKNAEQERHYHRAMANSVAKEIARLRNACVLRARRGKAMDREQRE